MPHLLPSSTLRLETFPTPSQSCFSTLQRQIDQLNPTMAAAEQNFQPQVGDTTAGPHIHTYIPRADGSILVNGIAYVRQSVATIPVAASVPVAAAVVVEAPAPVVQMPYYPRSPYDYMLYPQLYPQFASLSLPVSCV